MFDYPNKLNIIFDKLYLFGIKPIIVGGFVRDSLVNLESKDIDIELYGLDSLDTLETILHEFGEVNTVGKSFGVCKLNFGDLELDFSLPREDSKIDSGHKGFSVRTNKNLDFKSAAKRRDFTINAMGYDVKEKKLLDPYGGQKDIQNKILRAVDINKFAEDPLRILRGIQFSSRFNFTLDTFLVKLFTELINKNILEELPKERIYEELKKMFLKSSSPSIGLILLKRLNLMEHFGFSENYEQVDYFAKHKTEDEKLNILIFLSLIYAREKLGFIKKLSNELKLLTHISLYIEIQKDFDIDDSSAYTLYTLAKKVNIGHFLLYLDAHHAGKQTYQINILKDNAKTLSIFDSPLAALIQGKELIKCGLVPSKKFSVILFQAYEAQKKGKFKTPKEAQKWLKNYLTSLS
ncbi:MAG: CCA-adding enzyme [uncultured Sulfurimonas sp.]|nr:MAG: CCA-adding enzyme [uncultured Sulfurimonas sp.]